MMDGSPALAWIQPAPPSMLLNTPLLPLPLAVPTYSVVGVCGSTSRPTILVFGGGGRPALTAIQLFPRSVLLNTPLLIVPAYSVVGVCGSMATPVTHVVTMPV